MCSIAAGRNIVADKDQAVITTVIYDVLPQGVRYRTSF